MADFIAQPAFEIGRRLDLRGLDSYSWFVVLAPIENGNEALDNFRIDLGAAINASLRIVTVQGGLSLDDVRGVLQMPANDVVILTGFEGFSADAWSAWDVYRSGFTRPGPIVLWLSAAALAELCATAPNLRSFIGGSIFALSASGGALTEKEVSDRIQQLESHYKVSSEEIIERAATGILPSEPQLVEWLVLLGRGDLI